mgnify:CR=1 FL=1
MWRRRALLRLAQPFVHQGDIRRDAVAQGGWIKDFDARTHSEDDEGCFPFGVELDAQLTTQLRRDRWWSRLRRPWC